MTGTKLTFQYSTQGNDYADCAIRAFQHGWCPYTHVDVVCPDGALLGARMDGGVLKRPPGYAVFSAVKTLSLDVSEAQSAAFWAFLEAQLNKPYDVTAIALMMLPAIFVDTQGAMVAAEGSGRSSPTEADSWFCSELSMAAKIAAGIVPTLPALCKIISPADDLLVAVAIGGK